MKLLLVGCGGYAAVYVDQLFSEKNTDHHQLVGVVDPYAANSRVYEKLLAHHVPIFDSLEKFYGMHQAELALICTPIALHVHDATCCFANGSHVLLEKPIAATSQQARQIIEAGKKAGKKLGIGFQLCYDPVMLTLKQEIDSGKLGHPLLMRAMVFWQRGYAYYARTGGWAGKLRLADGSPVYDAILTNATAHYVMNMLWLTTPGYFTRPALHCEARLGRAYPIETFDTAAARFDLPCGCPGMVYVSHVAGAENEQFPTMRYSFENAEVEIDPVAGADLRVVIREKNGRVRELGIIQDSVINKINVMARSLETNAALTCPGEAALSAVLTNEMLFDSDSFAVEELAPICLEDKRWVPGLAKTLRHHFERGTLPDRLTP